MVFLLLWDEKCFGPDWNISRTIWWTAIKFATRHSCPPQDEMQKLWQSLNTHPPYKSKFLFIQCFGLWIYIYTGKSAPKTPLPVLCMLNKNFTFNPKHSCTSITASPSSRHGNRLWRGISVILAVWFVYQYILLALLRHVIVSAQVVLPVLRFFQIMEKVSLPVSCHK